MSFHWRDGWYWSRLPDGSVEIRNHGDFKGGAPRFETTIAQFRGQEVTNRELRNTTLVIPAAEWASIIASVSKAGETTESYQRAVAFHDAGREGIAEAEARLIAAAPDMLAVCQMIVDAVEGGDEMAVVDAARAAVAKATEGASPQ